MSSLLCQVSAAKRDRGHNRFSILLWKVDFKKIKPTTLTALVIKTCHDSVLDRHEIVLRFSFLPPEGDVSHNLRPRAPKVGLF